MTDNFVITSMLKDGIDIYKKLTDNLSDDLINTLKKETYKNNAQFGDVTLISHKSKQIYSAIFTYKDNPDERENLYNLHIICNDKIKGMQDMIKNLAVDFKMLGLHRLGNEDLIKLSNAIQNYDPTVDISLDNHALTLQLKWAIS